MAGARSDIIASLAMLVSLASAGWSVYGYVKSSEIRTLPLEQVTFLRDNTAGANIPQIWVEPTLVNLAIGDYGDVIEAQSVTLESGTTKLVFVPKFAADVRVSDLAIEDAPSPDDRCYVGGQKLLVCERDDAPKVGAISPGQALSLTPLFELASEECGLPECAMTFEQLTALLEKPVKLTYTARTLRDGEHAITCDTTLSGEQVRYLRALHWLTTGCAKGGAA